MRTQPREKNGRRRTEGWPLLTDLCPGNEVGPNGDNPGSRGGGDLHLWSSSDVRRFPDPLVITYRHSVTHLSLISVLDGYSAELVSAGGAQGAYEQHGTLRKSEGCRDDGVQLQGDKCNVEWEASERAPLKCIQSFGT